MYSECMRYFFKRKYKEFVVHFQDRSCTGDICVEGQTCESLSTNHVHCVTTYCPQPDPILYSRILGNLNHVGAKRRYECVESVSSGGNVTIECLENGTWSSSDIQCLVYGAPVHGEYLFKSWSFPAQTYKNVSITECGHHCNNESTHCMSFNYFSANRTCITVTNIIYKNTVPLSGWEVYERVFPVILTRPPDVSRYALTHPQARDYCTGIGARIATTADVRKAQSLGFNKCTCGWTGDNNYAVLSMTLQATGCIGIGVLACKDTSHSGKYDVFCTNPEYHDDTEV